LDQKNNLALQASLNASSTFELGTLEIGTTWKSLAISAAQLLPMEKASRYAIQATVRARCTTELVVQLRTAEKPQNFTPDHILEEQHITLRSGEQTIAFEFNNTLANDQYGFVCFLQNSDVEIACSDQRLSGVVSVFNGENKAVSNTGKQIVDGDIGIDQFEFWIPERRPEGQNLWLTLTTQIQALSPKSLVNGYTRPYLSANAWVAALDDKQTELAVIWNSEQLVSEITLHFDADFDQ